MAVTFSVLIRTGKYLLVASLICAMAGSIIFATWHVTNRFTHAWEREAMREAGARAAERGATYAGKINRHLLAFDKALERMAEEWEKNPDSFASTLWRARVAEYAPLSREMFLTDHNGLIRLASLGEFAGQSAAGLDAFREALEHAAEPPRLHVSKPAINAIMRQWHLDVTRPLRFPDGSFAGVLAMEYRLSEITPIFEAAPTDAGDFVAVFDRRDGQLRAAHVPGGAPATGTDGTALGTISYTLSNNSTLSTICYDVWQNGAPYVPGVPHQVAVSGVNSTGTLAANVIPAAPGTITIRVYSGSTTGGVLLAESRPITIASSGTTTAAAIGAYTVTFQGTMPAALARNVDRFFAFRIKLTASPFTEITTGANGQVEWSTSSASYVAGKSYTGAYEAGTGFRTKMDTGDAALQANTFYPFVQVGGTYTRFGTGSVVVA